MGWAGLEARSLTRARSSLIALGASVGFLFAAQAVRAEPSQVASLTPGSTIASAVAVAQPAHANWPTSGWPTSAPEAQGIDSHILAQALEQIRARHIPVHSLLIERHGVIVLDSYFYPFADNKPHNVFSVTKSVTSMLVGIAMAEHRLADLNAPVLSLLPLQVDDPRKEHITLANLLSMTSGLDCRPAGGTSLLQQMLRSRHLAEFMLSRPATTEPGTVFDYCGGNAEVVSAVLTRTTGASALEFARERLFAPLGITRASWPTDADHVSHGWGDLELQPRDMAKLGYLWLHNGRWEDKQIIPADYLAQALSRHVSVQPGIDYGYGVWLYPGHTPVDFEANGAGGQRITVIPSLDTVEVMTGAGLDANVVSEMIAPAIRSESMLPADREAATRLAALTYQAALPVGRRSNVEVLASVPASEPKPAAPAQAVEVLASVPAPEPKPAAPTQVLEVLASVPVPELKPTAPTQAVEVLASVPTPEPKPAAPARAAARPTMDLRVVVYPRPKPNLHGDALAFSIPIPRPKPATARSIVVAEADIPLPRPKPRPTAQVEAAVAGIAVAPNTALGLRPAR